MTVPERAPYSPLRRVIALLDVLTPQDSDRSERFPLTDTELMERTQAYGTHPGRERNLRNDKAALRARGLVVTNVPVARHRSVRGTVRAALLEKAPEWHLTADEHRALQAVRGIMRRRILKVGPSEPASPVARRANNRVDESLRLLRLLEEHEGEVEVEVVAEALGVGWQQAARWLTELADGLNSEMREVVLLHYDCERDDLTYRDLRAASIVRPSTDPAHPLEGTGTWLLGLFPYSRAEVDERLRLIAVYRASVAADGAEAAVDNALLASIEWKLRHWADFLDASKR